MVEIKQLNILVLSVLVAITVLNMGLAFNFIAASGRALAAILNSESIFLLAGIELAAVLLVYIVYKQRTFALQA